MRKRGIKRGKLEEKANGTATCKGSGGIYNGQCCWENVFHLIDGQKNLLNCTLVYFSRRQIWFPKIMLMRAWGN